MRAPSGSLLAVLFFAAFLAAFLAAAPGAFAAGLGLGLEDAPGGGAMVSQVAPDSPAESAGIENGDVIIQYGQKPISGSLQLEKEISESRPGSREAITVLRNGQVVSINARVAPSTQATQRAGIAAKPAPASLKDFGLEVHPITPALRSKYNISDREGLVVTDVQTKSVAASAKMQPGDVIKEVDNQKVTNVKQADNVISNLEFPANVYLYVDRRGEPGYVGLETG